jgi:hypothetical protein
VLKISKIRTLDYYFPRDPKKKLLEFIEKRGEVSLTEVHEYMLKLGVKKEPFKALSELWDERKIKIVERKGFVYFRKI